MVEDAYFTASGWIPKANRPVYAGGEHVLAIGGIRNTDHQIAMTYENMHGLAASDIPQTGSLISTACGDDIFAVRRKCYSINAADVPREDLDCFTVHGIPQAGSLIRASGKKIFTIWREDDIPNLSGVSGKDADSFASGKIPEPHGFIIAASHDVFAIRREVYAPQIRSVTFQLLRWNLKSGQTG